MTKLCDHASVGLIVVNDAQEVLLIERKNYPQAIALPAGHLDGDTFEEGLLRETREEVGIDVIHYKLLLSARFNNPCKRIDGSYHDWKVYKATQWQGNVQAGSDAKRAFWALPDQLRKHALRTEYFVRKYKIRSFRLGSLTEAIFGNSMNPKTDSEWIETPGLEPVWYEILRLSKFFDCL